MDRVVCQSTNLVFQEIFEPDFSKSNYGFRRGHSQRQAIYHVQMIVQEGYEWCVSIDLARFFDEIPHNLILKLIRRKVADERLVTLIARALKAGTMVGGRLEKTTKGCPQGSPLSPMLSNIVLNELDQELEKRGHRYCRWADDFVILKIHVIPRCCVNFSDQKQLFIGTILKKTPSTKSFSELTMFAIG